MKKIIIVFLSIMLVISSSISVSAEEISAHGINFADCIVNNEAYYTSNITLNYIPNSMSRGVTSVNSQYFMISDNLTSSDAVDFYTFSVSGTKSMVFALVSSNSGYVAIVCPYNPTTGDVTLNGPYVNANQYNPVLSFNSSGQNNYCIVVLNQGGTYDDAGYTLVMNATNSGTASSFVNYSNNLEFATFKYPNGICKMNNVNVKQQALNYIANHFSDTRTLAFRRVLNESHPGSVYNICTVEVKITASDIGSPLYYGTYTSNYRSTDTAVFLPLVGGSYRCHRQTNIDGSYQESGVPNGYLVYDLQSDEIIDWSSNLNFFYMIYYNEQRHENILETL